MTVLRPAEWANAPKRDPALAAFRAAMGAWAEGRTDVELARLKVLLDWLVDTAVAQTSRPSPVGVASETP